MLMSITTVKVMLYPHSSVFFVGAAGTIVTWGVVGGVTRGVTAAFPAVPEVFFL